MTTGTVTCQRFALSDPAAGEQKEQHAAAEVIRRLEIATIEAMRRDEGRNPQLLLDGATWPGVPAWMALRKHAIALHPLYAAPSLDRLGVHLTMADLDQPMFDGGSAFDVLKRILGSARAAAVRARYSTFLETPYTDALRLLFTCADARGIRWRAAAAASLAAEHARGWSNGAVRVVSLGCGAAGPMAAVVQGLRAAGVEVDRLRLLDRDPVALAAAVAVATQRLPRHHVDAMLFDLVDMRTGAARSLQHAVAGEQTRLVDILGLFEYLPDALAVDVLTRAREILRPDGAVVLANMLDVRPQQTFFEHVVQWPALLQRDVDHLLDLTVQAGFDPRRATVLLPPEDDAVYAVTLLRA